jgi:hypothetical protein
VKGRVGLGRENDSGARLSNNARRAMIGEGAFRACDDLLSLVGEEDDKIVLFPFPNR